MVALEELRPTERRLVMDLVAEAGLDISDWPNYSGKHPASNPRYCYEWVFTEKGKPAVACLWFRDLQQAPDRSIRLQLNLWRVAKKQESFPGRSAVAKRARSLDMALQKSFRERSPIRVILVDGEQGDLVSRNPRSSKVDRRTLDPASWTVAEYDWSTGDCLLVRNEGLITESVRAREKGVAPAGGNSSPLAEHIPTYIARLAYNSRKWRRPATATEVQEAEDTYRSENGFGHEDWLFRSEWELDGWRYAFVQGVNRSRAKLLRQGTPFNLRLFTMPASGDRRPVAEIRNVECLDDEAAIAAVAGFEERGWLSTMRAEVTAAGGRPEALDESGYAPHILNLRYRAKNLTMLDAGAPLPPEDPTHKLTRYGLYEMAGAMDTAVAGMDLLPNRSRFRISPISADDYRLTFQKIEISDSERRWLVAHYYSPEAKTSMSQLASALGYSDYRAANGAYGALAHKVAVELPRPPEDVEEGKYVDWLQSLAQLVERDALSHTQWQLRDEVAQAMLVLGWVDAKDAAADEGEEPPSPDDQRKARELGLDDTQIEQMMLSRRGQGRFRNETLKFWGGCCAVSGLSDVSFLVASHIKPWKVAEPNERLDGFNGLPLTPNLDRAFDRGYVSFSDDGSIMISPAMSKESMRALGINPDMALRFCDSRTSKYLAYHRDHVFVRES